MPILANSANEIPAMSRYYENMSIIIIIEK